MKVGNKYLYKVCSNIYISECFRISSDGKTVFFTNGGYIGSDKVIKNGDRFIEDATHLLSDSDDFDFRSLEPILSPSPEVYKKLLTGQTTMSEIIF